MKCTVNDLLNQHYYISDLEEAGTTVVPATAAAIAATTAVTPLYIAYTPNTSCYSIIYPINHIPKAKIPDNEKAQ